MARRTARIVILGQRGSGKATLSAKLGAKYNLVIINVNELIDREKLSGSRLGMGHTVWRKNLSIF